MIRNFASAIFWAVLSSIYASAHAEAQYEHGQAYGRTTEQALQDHHLGLSKAALIAALRNPEPEVRPLAARKLLQDRYLDTIPLIEAALSDERVPTVRIRIAFALAEAGINTGFSELQNACEDHSLSMIDRVEASRGLLAFGRESCLGAIMEALQFRDGQSNSREIALSLVPGLRHLSDADSDLLFDLVVRNLTDRNVAARIGASQALNASGRVSAIPQLQTAIRNESDDAVREVMQGELRALIGQQEQHRSK